MLVRVEKGTDGQRRIGAERGDPFADLLRVQQRFVGLLAQPGNNGDATESEDQKRIVGVANDTGELRLEYAIQYADDFVLVDV